MIPTNDIPTASILVVEDDPQVLWLFSKALREYRLTCVSNGSEALESIRQSTPDLILLDHLLSDGELGGDFIPRLKDVAAHVPIILVSGSLGIEDQLRLLQGPRSASFVILKPFRLTELERTIEIALTECGMGEAVRMLQSIERAEKFDRDEPDRRYVERLARQFDMLKQIRSSRAPINISLFSRMYRVSRRTIARDIRELIRRGQICAMLCPDLDRES